MDVPRAFFFVQIDGFELAVSVRKLKLKLDCNEVD